jgi:hypothetical protein
LGKVLAKKNYRSLSQEIFRIFKELESLLPYTQKPAADPNQRPEYETLQPHFFYYIIFNIVTCWANYLTGFGKLIGFTGHFDTARDYTLQHTVTHTHIIVHSHVFIAVAW